VTHPDRADQVGDVRVRIVKPAGADAVLPVAIEQGYAAAQWVIREGADHGLDASRMAVAGEVRGLPPTLVFVDEADVLRDEGEAYGAKLRSAGVAVTTVRYDGTVHDFMLPNSLTGTRATRASVEQATGFLRAALTAK
jgi:acetyl esterase/lipase